MSWLFVLCLSTGLIGINSSFSEAIGDIRLMAKVESFDDKSVTVNAEGNLLVFPRTAIHSSRLVAGASMEVIVSENEYHAALRKSLLVGKKSR